MTLSPDNSSAGREPFDTEERSHTPFKGRVLSQDIYKKNWFIHERDSREILLNGEEISLYVYKSKSQIFH